MRSRFLVPAVLFSLSVFPAYAQTTKPVNKAALVKSSDALIAARNYRQAALELSKAIALNPRDAELYMLRSFAYGAGGEQHKAEDDRQAFTNINYKGRKPLLARLHSQFQALATREPKNFRAYLNMGDVQSYLMDYPGALKSYNQAIALAPQFPLAYTARGFVYAQTNEFDKALADCNRAIALQPKDFDAYICRAYVYLNQRKLDLALKDCNKAISLDPNNSSSFWFRGLVQGSRGNSEEAVRDYDKSILLNPLSANYYIGRASVRFALQQSEIAREDLEIAEQLTPDNSEIYSIRAVIYNQRKEYAQAVAQYDRAIALSPKNASFYYLRAENLIQLPEKSSTTSSKALADYNRAVEVAPKDPLVYLFRASYYYSKDESAKALSDLAKVTELDPNNVDAYSIRAAIYSKLGEDEKAIVDYRKMLAFDKSNTLADSHIAIYEATQAIKADPTVAANFAKRAQARINLGETPGALADYNEAIRLDPQNPTYYNFRGVLYGNQRSRLEAIADFDRAIEADPKFTQAYVNRMSASPDSAQTFVESEKVIKVDPGNISAYTTRAALYLAQDQADLALADYNRILQLDPKQVDIYRARAELYVSRKEPLKAIADYDAAIRLSPTNGKLFTSRAWLYFKQGDLNKAEADFKKAYQIEASTFSTESENVQLAAMSRRIAANPKSAAAYLDRARIFISSPFMSLRDPIAANMVLADLKKASALAPRSTEPRLLLARFFDTNSSILDRSTYTDPTRAIEASTAGLKIDPKIAELYNIRGNNYMSQGNYQKAVADYVAAGKLDPGYSAGLYGRSFFGRTEEWNKAIASFSAAVARSPRSAAAYFNRAVIYADMSVWDKAIADYSQAIRLDPKLANAYYLRGVAQFQMATDFDVRSYKNKMTDAKRRSVFYRATADYGTAIRLDPKFASAYYQRAVALEELTKDAAVRDYSTFIQLNPAYSGHAHYKRGEIYQGRKEWDKVIADFKAYRQLPRPISTKSMVYYMDSSAPHRIADAYMEKGDISRGIAMYDEAMNVPGEGRYSNLRDRGLAYVLKGDIPKAMADLNAAVLLRPNYADAYTSRAKAYRKLGQVERAGLDEQMAAVLSPKK